MPNFPTSLDTLTNPTATDTLASPAHHTQHTDANDILEAVETKLGTGASTPTTTGHVLTVTGAGATAYQAAGGSANLALSAGPLASTLYARGNVIPLSTTIDNAPLNKLFAVPLAIAFAQTFDRIAINVTTGAAGNIRLGIYQAHSSTYLPDALLLDAGTVDVSTTGVKEITISRALSVGLYWLALVASITTPLTFSNVSSRRALFGASAVTVSDSTYLRRDFVYAALPTPWGSGSYFSGDPPLVALRAA